MHLHYFIKNICTVCTASLLCMTLLMVLLCKSVDGHTKYDPYQGLGKSAIEIWEMCKAIGAKIQRIMRQIMRWTVQLFTNKSMRIMFLFLTSYLIQFNYSIAELSFRVIYFTLREEFNQILIKSTTISKTCSSKEMYG